MTTKKFTLTYKDSNISEIETKTTSHKQQQEKKTLVKLLIPQIPTPAPIVNKGNIYCSSIQTFGI